uniref:Neprosin PEP catalytic domain-containing protein n=1 Tax=Cucumis melo TaxID=3656 RepID=A0A9I9D9H4_CUCME
MGPAQIDRRTAGIALLLLFSLWFLISLSHAARLSPSMQNLEVQKHLRRLNKPPLKTIQSPDGDIIDCVHISNQPAFDHPFLKDHKIQVSTISQFCTFFKYFFSTCPEVLYHLTLYQTRPTYHPEGLFDENKVSEKPKEITNPINQLWHANGRCPENTIPIRRTKEDDVLRASSVKRYGKKRHRAIPQPRSADPDLINQSGHQSDAYQATGCYNLLCSGFIQVNSDIAMGASISPVSGFRSSQYDISILIWKDPNEGHWWMQFGNDYVLGYWPSFLFSYLADSASMIEWGGEVVNSEADGLHTLTQMGSGHFPEEGFGKASYFRNIQVVDSSNNLKAPKGIGTFTEQSNCYDVQTGSNGDWGHYFYYGGPGRNQNCP